MTLVVLIGAFLFPGDLAGNDLIRSRIPRHPVASTAIAAVGYSRKLRALEIEFRNGSIYRYLDVPPDIFRHLVAADSITSYYDSEIRHHFRSVHVQPDP